MDHGEKMNSQSKIKLKLCIIGRKPQLTKSIEISFNCLITDHCSFEQDNAKDILCGNT